MRILALDPSASKTGFAIFDPPAEAEMKVGTFPCDGDTHERRADSMATALIQLINAHKPQLIVHEMPLRNIKSFRKKPPKQGGLIQGMTRVGDNGGPPLDDDGPGEMTMNASTALMLNQIVGAIRGVCKGYGIPCIALPSTTWRKAVYGKGDTARGMGTVAWKKLAREHCKMRGISVKNNDAAEAAMIAIAARATQTYRMMREVGNGQKA